MKTITVTSVTVVGTDITIVGTLADTTFSQPSQQLTVPDLPSGNRAWSRMIRATDAAIFCLRNGANGVALTLASWAKIGFSIEPTLTWPIIATTAPTAQSAVHASTTATFALVIRENELTSTYQWKECDTVDGTYTNVTNVGGVVCYSGGTTATLVITPTTIGRHGYYYKCVVSNARGEFTTTPVMLTVT